uniref:Uncharacterized protein n=1 Tax=Oryza brachyantha TaxID=4533 RepID=J3LFM9_ORYBR
VIEPPPCLLNTSWLYWILRVLLIRNNFADWDSSLQQRWRRHVILASSSRHDLPSLILDLLFFQIFKLCGVGPNRSSTCYLQKRVR